jgi:hypothetical protein
MNTKTIIRNIGFVSISIFLAVFLFYGASVNSNDRNENAKVYETVTPVSKVSLSDEKTSLEELSKQTYETIMDDISDEQIEEFLDNSKTEIQEELDNIEKEYEVGEPLKEEDAQFIVLLANVQSLSENGSFETKSANAEFDVTEPFVLSREPIPAEKVATYTETRNTGNNVKVFPTKYGIQMEFDWYIKITEALSGTSSYRSKLEALALKGHSKIQSLTLTTYHSCYGVVGTKGVLKIYSGSHTSGKIKNSTAKSDLTSKYFTLLPILTNTYAELKVQAKDGTFNCTSPSYTWTW